MASSSPTPETPNQSVFASISKAASRFFSPEKSPQQLLMRAIYDRNISLFLSEMAKGTNPDFVSERGETPLFAAATKGDPAATKALLAAGASPNLRETSYGQTPLFAAADNDRPDIVKILLDAGADPKICDSEGLSPLGAAILSVNLGIVQTLAPLSDLKAANLKGMTPLMVACSNQRFEPCVSPLLDSGSDINAKDISGQTPLAIAASARADNSVSILVARGADINSTSNSGQTPLMIACRHCNRSTALLLVSLGASTSFRDIEGKDALYYASRTHDRMEGVARAIEAAHHIQNPKHKQGQSVAETLAQWINPARKNDQAAETPTSAFIGFVARKGRSSFQMVCDDGPSKTFDASSLPDEAAMTLDCLEIGDRVSVCTSPSGSVASIENLSIRDAAKHKISKKTAGP